MAVLVNFQCLHGVQYVARMDIVIAILSSRKSPLVFSQLAKLEVVATVTIMVAVQKRAAIRIVIKQAAWSGKVGGLALPTGSSRRVARRYSPMKTKETADLTNIC